MAQPLIYEINTATFLFELSATLDTVPDAVWDQIAAEHFNTVWLMGVWQRSDMSVKMAIGQPWVEAALPGATDEDVIGSAYSIQSYTVDARFGGNDGLAIARAKLKERGMRLMLDYVPNHVAIDHEWTLTHPDYFLPGTPSELAEDPDSFKQVGDHIYANGRDPHFPAWSDVLQLNAFSPGLRAQTIETLQTIADMCDSVRCDMAMLMMNDIFAKTWQVRGGKAPADEFWPAIIQAVKSQRPDFTFLAEVYWEREAALIGQGFDYCYDKELYDAIVFETARAVRERLHQTAAIQSHLLSFVENHDEPRATQMDWPRHQAAAVIMATLPGARLYHDGQSDGRTMRVPVQLRRRPTEQKNDSVHAFYEQLQNATFALAGDWKLLEVHHGLFANGHLLAWQWGNDVILVNLGKSHTTGLLPVAIADAPRFGTFEKRGKHVGMVPWGYAIATIASPDQNLAASE